MAQKYYFGGGLNRLELQDKLFEIFTEIGADVEKVGTSGIKINEWNGKTYSSSAMTGVDTSSNNNYYFIRNIEGKELVVCLPASYSSAQTSVYGTIWGLTVDRYLYGQHSSGSSSSSVNIPNLFFVPNVTLNNSDKITFSKILIAKCNEIIGGQYSKIADQDLYYSDALLAPGSIYTDGNGKKFIAFNQAMACSYEE